MKNLLNLGKILNKAEQKTINGGGDPSLCSLPACTNDGDACCLKGALLPGICAIDPFNTNELICVRA